LPDVKYYAGLYDITPISRRIEEKKMTPRERFNAIINHREADRVPIDFGRHVGSLHREAYISLKAHLKDAGLKNENAILDRMVQNIFPDEKLLQKFNVDFRWLVPNWVGVEDIDEGTYRDMWGIHWQYMLTAYSTSYSPLEKATLADLESYNWPDPYNPDMFRGLGAQAKYWHENTDYVIVADSIKGGILTKALQIRGYEQMFADLANDPDFTNALLDKLLWLYKEMWTQYLNEVGPYTQMVYFTDDIGAQNAMMISPDTFRSLIKPRLKELIDHIKGLADVKFMYHTDGTVAPVIEDIIEMGVDVLNPIQTSATGMETAWLNAEFGDRLCFHGAIDVQQMLPFSTPEEVRYDVAKRLHDLAPGGGYILSTCHDVGADVPPENVIAMFEAAYEYGTYPIDVSHVLRDEDLNPTIVGVSYGSQTVEKNTVRQHAEADR
jgi:uroporphyrinogen decarboxylase